MDFRPDDRGQAIQVGAVLLFAMLIIAMSVYQAQVVPRENAEIEFDNYLQASSDMTELRNAMMGVAASNTERGTTVTTGTQYPARVFFVNPAPATGRITTEPAGNISIANVKSPSDRANVDTFLQSENSRLEYSTSTVEFTPQYNEIDVAPIVTANGYTYRNYSSPVSLTTQTIIRGNRLTFVTVEGEFDAGGTTIPLTTNPVSAHTRTVTVTNRTTAPLNVTVPTPIPASTWETEILAGQMDPTGTNPDRYVTAVGPGPEPNTVNITLEAGETYELRLGRIELHEKSDVSQAETPPPRYLTSVTDTNTRTERDGRKALTVEARDRFNNPVSNTNVTFNQSSDKGSFETKAGDPVSFPLKTDDEGQATVYYNATGHLGTIPVDAWLGTSNPPEDEKDVRFSVFNNVLGGGGGGGGSSGEQAGRNLVVLESISGISGKDDDDLTLNINNTGDFDVNATGYRVDYVTGIKPNGNLVEGPTEITWMLFDGTENRTGVAKEGGRPYLFGSDPVGLTPGSHTVEVQFNDPFGWDPNAAKTENIQGIFIGFSIYLEGEITVTFQVHIIL